MTTASSTVDDSLVVLDGSAGEGGGQILRTALSLSAVTGRPFVLDQIRAGRKKPGLMRQHLTCVQAAQALCGASTAGAELRSTSLRFVPGAVRGGNHRFAIGTAGCTTLVAQTVVPIALCGSSDAAGGVVRVDIEGGTRVPFSPPVDFLERCFVPALARQGAQVNIHETRAGFYPAGGGALVVDATPFAKHGVSAARPLVMTDRGKLTKAEVIVVCAPPSEPEAQTLSRALRHALVGVVDVEVRSDVQVKPSPGPGLCGFVALTCEAHGGDVSAVFSVIPNRGERADAVARACVDAARAWLDAGVCVDEHLADQLLLPMALGAGGCFSTTTPSLHFSTNVDVIRRFLPNVDVAVADEGGGRARVTVTRG